MSISLNFGLPSQDTIHLGIAVHLTQLRLKLNFAWLGRLRMAARSCSPMGEAIAHAGAGCADVDHGNHPFKPVVSISGSYVWTIFDSQGCAFRPPLRGK